MQKENKPGYNNFLSSIVVKFKEFHNLPDPTLKKKDDFS